MPVQTKERYLNKKSLSNIFIWNFNNQYKYFPKGKVLRIQCLAAANIRWSTDNWQTIHDVSTLNSEVGIHYADIPTEKLDHEEKIVYTFYWHEARVWENKNYKLTVEKEHVTSVPQ